MNESKLQNAAYSLNQVRKYIKANKIANLETDLESVKLRN